jgi:hypothetical protein
VHRTALILLGGFPHPLIVRLEQEHTSKNYPSMAPQYHLLWFEKCNFTQQSTEEEEEEEAVQYIP